MEKFSKAIKWENMGTPIYQEEKECAIKSMWGKVLQTDQCFCKSIQHIKMKIIRIIGLEDLGWEYRSVVNNYLVFVRPGFNIQHHKKG